MDNSGTDHGDDVTAHLAARLRSLRADRGLTLEALAERAGVSRSMISLVERGESSPTAAVLARLAAGLGVTLASLFAGEARTDASPLARRADQRAWRDPETGYLRRNLSAPHHPSPLELVEVILPAGTRVAYDNGGRSTEVGQQVWVVEGLIDLTWGEETWRLEAGDCLSMRLDRPTAFRNPAGEPARYLVALAVDSGGPRRGSPA
jgi:transcriptional regulator with XRE-family HTH domain